MINLKQNYSNIKSFISENGMGVENEQRFLKDGRIEDDYRIRFLQDHLYWHFIIVKIIFRFKRCIRVW